MKYAPPGATFTDWPGRDKAGDYYLNTTSRGYISTFNLKNDNKWKVWDAGSWILWDPVRHGGIGVYGKSESLEKCQTRCNPK